MKKLFISLFSFILILAGGFLSANFFPQSSDAAAFSYDIYTAAELVNTLSNESVYNNQIAKITLQKDIDLTDVDLTPISNVTGDFRGVFDGNGHRISNIKYASSNQYFALIPRSNSATIQDIQIEGKIEFVFNELNISELYVGGIVGVAENTTFKNCEFNSDIEDEGINLPVYSDFNFGMLAGKVKGNPLANVSGNRANIKDCVNYYNINVDFKKQKNVYIGGLVGNAQNAYFLNTLNFGNITLANSIADGGDEENTSKHFIGGLAGSIGGSGTHIRNSCFAGEFHVTSIISALKLYQGAIFGGVTDSSVSKDNIIFDYYTDESISICGDNYIYSSDKLCLVDAINKAFLTNVENFDEQSENQPFDFNETWSLTESRFHLQSFLVFDFNFKAVLNNTIQSARFIVNKVPKTVYTAAYNETVSIQILFKDEFVGYFKLSGITLSNLNFDMNKAEIIEIRNNLEQISGYNINVQANATTSGSYDFLIQSITYNCVATVSEEAIANDQGGVRIAENNTSTTEMNIPFTYNSPLKKIIAEGTSGSVYTFDCWKLYYKEESGEFSETETSFVNSTDGTLSISFGAAPFNKEFKLVAYFTDESAIMVDFGEINTKKIKSIKFDGRNYEGQAIAVSPNHAKTLDIVTAKDYKLNLTAFEEFIQKLYGETYTTETLMIADPAVNQEGETTYKFSINMKYIKVEKNKLSLILEVEKDNSNNNSNLLWLWITIPCVAVLLIGVVIFIIVRRRRYGGKGGKGGKTTAKVKERKVSYKDYY